MSDRSIAARAIALLDLTELGDAASEADIRALCAKARGGGAVPAVAAVCVWPRHVALARGLLHGSRIRVATVINFPAGTAPRDVVIAEAHDALGNGADEIDLVMPYAAFLAGDAAAAGTMITRVKAVLPPGRRLKVILETSAYSDRATIRAASDLAIAAGADFIKTSTGKIAGGASLDAARAMLDAIRASGRAVGLKPSGGIRSLEDAKGYLALADTMMGADWATPATFRFGASGLHGALATVLGGAEGTQTTGY